jgi:hypothetical protein
VVSWPWLGLVKRSKTYCCNNAMRC